MIYEWSLSIAQNQNVGTVTPCCHFEGKVNIPPLKGAFKNHVENRRWVRGKKFNTFSKKKVSTEVGGLSNKSPSGF